MLLLEDETLIRMMLVGMGVRDAIGTIGIKAMWLATIVCRGMLGRRHPSFHPLEAATFANGVVLATTNNSTLFRTQDNRRMTRSGRRIATVHEGA